MATEPAGDLDVRVVPAAELSDGDRAGIARLFDLTYRQANQAYLDVSFSQLRFVATAHDGERMVGFAAGDGRRQALPRLPGDHAVALAGICCIDPDYRRRGLFTRLGFDSIFASGAVDPDRPLLFAGRMAHPITYRTMVHRADNAIPRAGLALSDWHKEVGVLVAGLFGVTIDPDTFVVRGKGAPIGFPMVEYDATPEELELFATVDRARGDSLLAMSWMPSAPEGWGAGA